MRAAAGIRRASTWRMAHEISWRHDFDAAVTSAGDKLVLLDFSAAPM
jgi:hypothetical protein